MPLPPHSDSYRRRLLATGTSHFIHHSTLVQVPEEVDTVKKAFGTLNYELIPATLNPSPGDLEDWFYKACSACSGDDLLVLYYTGHGESEHGLYLLSGESLQATQDPPSRSTKVSVLAEILLKTQAAQVLLILDVCHAGAGASDFLKVCSELINQRPSLSPAYVIAATRAKDQADEGALSKALALALANSDCRFGGVNQRYLPMEEVMEAVKQYLLNHYPKQQAQWAGASLDGRCLFFPNPQHRPDIDRGLDLASQRAFLQHWLPKSGAIESGRAGSYFTGRQQALRQICEWFAQPFTQGGAMVVTGGPGTGKSALLGRLVTLSEANYREQVTAQKESTELLPEGTVNVAVHARHKLMGEVFNEITGQLNLPQQDVPSFLQMMSDLEKKTVIVVDALDEAEEAQAIVQQLLVPLSKLKHVFLLVGTRPDATAAQQRFAALGPDTVEINLENPQHTDAGEVASYVERRLLASEEPNRYTPYRQREALTRQVAEAVAMRAQNVFLVAHTVAIRLLELGEVVDTSRPDWIGSLPTGLAEAFNQYLAPLDACEGGLSIATVKGALRALAFAEGAGLPWANLWRSVAGAISHLPVTDEDIIEVRKFAAPFIVESIEHERSVYRLYHEQLAEYLRDSCSDDDGLLLRLWNALLTCVPIDDRGKPDWLRAHPYLKRHAASFAFKAGVLNEVTDDPAFMLVSDPPILRRYLKAHSGTAQPLVQVYLKAFGTLRALSEPERHSYFSLALMQSRIGLHLPRSAENPALWMPIWTAWNRPPSNHVLASLPSMVTALNVGLWGGSTPAVLVGRADGVIDVFQIDNGTQLVTWKTVADTEVKHVSTIMTPQGQLLVASWQGSQLGALNVRTQQEWFAPNDDPVREDVSALAVFCEDDYYFCVTAHSLDVYSKAVKQTELLLWNLKDFNLFKRQTQASRSGICSLLPVKTSDGMRILSGGDTYHQGKRCAEALQLWSLDLLALWKAPEDMDTNYVTAIYSRQSEGLTYVLPQDDSRPVRVWRVEPDGLVEICCLDMKVDGAWFSGSFEPMSLQLRRGDFTQGYAIGPDSASVKWLPFTPVSRMDGNVARWSDSVDVEGNPVVASASIGLVNIWNLGRALQEAGGTSFFNENPTCMFVSEATNGLIYCGTESGRILSFDIESGLQAWACTVNPGKPIRALTGYLDSSCLTLAVASQTQIVLVAAGVDVDPLAVINTGGHVYKLDFAWGADEPLLFASIDHGMINAVRIWNLRTRQEQGTKHTDQYDSSREWQYQLNSGQEDKPINSLVCHSQRGSLSTRLLFASKYSQIMVADYPSSEPARQSRPREEFFDTWKIPGSLTARILALAQTLDGNFIAAGTDEGNLTIWHYPLRKPLASLNCAHLTRRIKALAFNDTSAEWMLASGADDGFVRFWNSELEPLFHVNLSSTICGIRFIDASRVAVTTENGLVVIALGQRAEESIASA
ncbi:hypothetical protein BK672_28325 [Pseudomonas fluorescens]|jgi:WD40 repeat protein|uniref:NACHT domain-containing protein n=1 Tax=Pseudomonas fluorescens TaxID=294 RepID=A0A423MS44_PSEFL|nr:hypothetical protein BK672_28325 [Pseudomonas fluorescens]